MKTTSGYINLLITIIAFNAFVLSAALAVIFLELDMPQSVMVLWAVAGITLLVLSFVFLQRIKEFSIERFLQVAEHETAFTQAQIDMLQKEAKIRAELLEAQLTVDLFDDIQGLSHRLTEVVHQKLEGHVDDIATEKAKRIAKKMGERLMGDS